MQCEDVLGLRLPEALTLLGEVGVEPQICVTGKAEEGGDPNGLRVVQVQICQNRYILTVCAIPDDYR